MAIAVLGHLGLPTYTQPAALVANHTFFMVEEIIEATTAPEATPVVETPTEETTPAHEPEVADDAAVATA